MSAELFRDRVRELAQHLGIDGLVPNAHGVVSMAGNDGIWAHISYRPEDDRVHWTAAVANLTGRDSSKILRGVLSANLDQLRTKGCFFALEDTSQTVVLRYHEPMAGLHTQRFLEATDSFVGVIEFWKTRLAKALARTQEQDARSTALEFHGEASDAAIFLNNRV